MIAKRSALGPWDNTSILMDRLRVGIRLCRIGGSAMERNIDVDLILDILSRDNTVEVKRNKSGKIIILEVKKKIRKSK